MKIRLEKLHYIISKLAGGKNEKPRPGVLKWKTSGNPTENPSMKSKIIEFGIIFLHKYKVEQTELIFRLLFTFLLTNYKNVWSDRTFTLS